MSTLRAAQPPSVFSDLDIQRGRLSAALSYLLPFYLILPLRRRDNPYVLFHARQALGLWLAAVTAAFVLSMGIILLTVLLMSVPVSVTTGILSFGVLVLALVLAGVGARNAWRGSGEYLPYIGRPTDAHLSHLSGE